MFLIVLCSFWLHFSKLFMLLVRKNPRKNWKNDCLHLTLISNKITNILEVSQFCYPGREKKKQENLNLFFPGWALKSFALYTNQIIASQLRGKNDFGQKKITLPLDSHLSLILFHLIFLDPFFTFFDAHLLSGVHFGKCTQTTRMASPPMKIFTVPLPPQLWSLWKLHKFIGVIVER